MKSDAIAAAIEALWTGSRSRTQIVEEAAEQQPLDLRHSAIAATPDKADEAMYQAPDSASSAFYSAMHDRVVKIMATSPAMNHCDIRRSFDGLSAKLKQASQRQNTPSSDRRSAVLQ
jgi:hypothetical protein